MYLSSLNLAALTPNTQEVYPPGYDPQSASFYVAPEIVPTGTYSDEWGNLWRKNGDAWERQSNGEWLAADPDKTGLPFNIEPYRPYIEAYAKRVYYSELYDESGAFAVFHPERIANPKYLYALFDQTYAPFWGPANWNPYASIGNRDALRAFAVMLNLTPEDADQAALARATAHFVQYGQPYSEATPPVVVGDDIARALAKKAGVTYTGLTPDETARAIRIAENFQENLKGHREAYEDQAMWTHVAQIASIALPVLSFYVAGGTAAAGEAAAEAGTASGGAGAAGASAAAELTWQQLLGKALDWVQNLAKSYAGAEKIQPPKNPQLPGYDQYLEDLIGAKESPALTEQVAANPLIIGGAGLLALAILSKLARG